MNEWTQTGDWLEHCDGRFKIARMDLHDGRRYCTWDWDGDGLPKLVAVRDSAEVAKKLAEVGDAE